MPLEPSSNFIQASSWADDWQTLFYFEVGIFIFFSVLIFSAILYFAVRLPSGVTQGMKRPHQPRIIFPLRSPGP